MAYANTGVQYLYVSGQSLRYMHYACTDVSLRLSDALVKITHRKHKHRTPGV